MIVNNNNKKVFDKVQSIKKEELSKHKLELAIIDNVKQKVKEGSNMYERYVNDMDEAKARLSIAIKTARKAVSVLKDADKFRDDFEAQVKELGVDLPSDIARINTKVSFQIAQKDLDMMQSIFKQFRVR